VSWWSSAPIRLRLTIWYAGVLALLLALYATATFVTVRHEFLEQLEESEREHGVDLDAQTHLGQQLAEILFVLAVGFPVIVVLAGCAGYVLARRALAPIDRLAHEARRITAERLHQPLTVANEHDEIGRLAAVLNETNARLDASFEQLRRFTSDASHELRTPLAVMRGVGEMALGQGRTLAEYRDALASILEEIDRLTRLVDTLLRLSRADKGVVPLQGAPVDLGQLAREVVGSLAVLADERRQQLRVREAIPVQVWCDAALVREAVANLVDNAITYSPAASTIDVNLRLDGGRAIVSVSDQGPGIPPEHRERIFDRFYRIDEGRSRESGGTGLGLAIAKWAVEANGGRIWVEPSTCGSTFQISLPLLDRSKGEPL
jgi:heavy metal sensor kinase